MDVEFIVNPSYNGKLWLIHINKQKRKQIERLYASGVSASAYQRNSRHFSLFARNAMN